MPHENVACFANELGARSVTCTIRIVDCSPASFPKCSCIVKFFPAWTRWADELRMISPKLVDASMTTFPVHETATTMFAVCQEERARQSVVARAIHVIPTWACDNMP